MQKFYFRNKEACAPNLNGNIEKVEGSSFPGSTNRNDLNCGTAKLSLEQEPKYAPQKNQIVVSVLTHMDPAEKIKESETDKIVKNSEVTAKALAENICKQETLEKIQSNRQEDVMIQSPLIENASKIQDDNLLTSEWSQLASISLINDGTGLGIAIVTRTNVGIVIKNIKPGSVAEQDGRLRKGDHILQISTMRSEQVTNKLKKCLSNYRVIAARPVKITPEQHQDLSSSVPFVPTGYLNETTKIDNYLIKHKWPPIFQKDQLPTSFIEIDPLSNTTCSDLSNAPDLPSLPSISIEPAIKIPEMEKLIVKLRKGINGFGLAIPWYQNENLHGAPIKMIGKGSAADLSKKIKVNDRIMELDNYSLQGHTHLQIIRMLQNCGPVVKLGLERHVHGVKSSLLQQASTSAGSSTPRLTRYSTKGNKNEDNDDGAKTPKIRKRNTNKKVVIFDENSITSKWRKKLNPGIEIILARMSIIDRNGGLGINVKGTVDIENGKEVLRHYFIRRILREGPIDKNGLLKVGDELLEINGYQVLDMKFQELATFQKNLPSHVWVVCGRGKVKYRTTH